MSEDFGEFLAGREDDAVNHPPHYTKGRFETIDVLEDIIQFYPDPVLASQVWQTLKYLSRAPHKHDLVEDLEKARWYLERAIRTAKALELDREPS